VHVDGRYHGIALAPAQGQPGEVYPVGGTREEWRRPLVID
jgi:hypothetical protein